MDIPVFDPSSSAPKISGHFLKTLDTVSAQAECKAISIAVLAQLCISEGTWRQDPFCSQLLLIHFCCFFFYSSIPLVSGLWKGFIWIWFSSPQEVWGSWFLYCWGPTCHGWWASPGKTPTAYSHSSRRMCMIFCGSPGICTSRPPSQTQQVKHSLHVAVEFI